MKNIFYFYRINSIGGIETFFYNLARNHKDKDITIYYHTGDVAQVRRLRRYVRVIKWQEGMEVECDKAFFNFNTNIIGHVKAKEYGLILHGDYKAMGIKPPMHPKIDKYYGVSQIVCDSFKELTGKEATLIYNPFEADKPKRILRLISATRLTAEKGKGRMERLATALDIAGIPYIWTVFTDDTNAIDNPNICYMKPHLDITNYIASSDYLVQLSDNEGYCYSVVEALSLGVPVIVTELPVFKELKVQGITLPLDMKNVPVDKIYNSQIKVNWKAPESNWKDILAPGKSTYEEELKMMVKVKAREEFSRIIDSELGRRPRVGEVWTVTPERAKVLRGDNHLGVKLVDIVKEPKEKKEKKNASKKK